MHGVFKFNPELPYVLVRGKKLDLAMLRKQFGQPQDMVRTCVWDIVMHTSVMVLQRP